MASCKSQLCGRDKNNIFINSHRTTIAFWVDAEKTISGAQGGSKKTKNANPKQEFHWASAPTNEASTFAGIVVLYIKSRPKLGRLGGRPRSLIPRRLGWRQNMKIRSRAFSDWPDTRSMTATLPCAGGPCLTTIIWPYTRPEGSPMGATRGTARRNSCSCNPSKMSALR